MKAKKWLLPVCIVGSILVLLLVAVVTFGGILSANGYGITVGRFYATDMAVYLVDEGEAMILWDQSRDKELFDGLNTGDLVLVMHGGIETSYPSRTGAYHAFRLRKGGVQDLPENLDIGVVYDGSAGHIPAASAVAFEAQYIRTDGYHGELEYPIVRVIRSVQELNAYYEANKALYSLDHREDPASDQTMGFLDACEKYDEAYFAHRPLVLVLLEENSGSIRHKASQVSFTDEAKTQLRIDIERIVPESGTADMAVWHILIEPEAGTRLTDGSDITVYVDGVDPLTQPVLARQSKNHASISLTIPEGWAYKAEDGGENDFCIAFWPEGREEGRIKVWFYEAFGVCGTGLAQEKITLGEYEAYKGTYGGRKVWDFISLEKTPGTYVVINEGADAWWSEYGGEAMQILETLAVGDGIIGEAEAIGLAQKEVSAAYDQIRASFDVQNGIWTVTFSGKNTAGSDPVVTLTGEGKVIDVTYGE